MAEAWCVHHLFLETGEDLESVGIGVGEADRGEGLGGDPAIGPAHLLSGLQPAEGVDHVGAGEAPPLDDFLGALSLPSATPAFSKVVRSP